MNLLKLDVHSALEKLILTIAFQVSETLMRCAKASHKMIKFLTCEIHIRNHASLFYHSFELQEVSWRKFLPMQI